MREIVLDTETTGLDPDEGHRVIEIGCVELIDTIPTGNTFHCYLNPEREVPYESERVHGIKTEFLADKPLFGAIASQLMDFIGQDRLVIHNASFDMRFLNAEFQRVGMKKLPFTRAFDTIALAKEKIPGARYSLDELCKRFAIDLSSRTKHGALVDAELTAKVYLELLGGRQKNLLLAEEGGASGRDEIRPARQRPYKLEIHIEESELEIHTAFVAKELGADALWMKITTR